MRGTVSHHSRHAGKRQSGRAPGAALLMVLVICAVIFIVGMAAITAAASATRSGENYAAYGMALGAAQSGVVVARHRLHHPWYVGLDWGQNWAGTGGYVAMPQPDDGRPAKSDLYYSVTVTSTATQHSVVSTGRAVAPGGNVNSPGAVLAERTVKAVFSRAKVEIPYALVTGSSFTLPARAEVKGDVFCNGDFTLAAGAKVTGKIYATGNIYRYGTLEGQMYANAGTYPLPDIKYYGYRPNYDYNGIDTAATELGGTSLWSNPPLGMPGNPNNVFYSNASTFTLRNEVTFDAGTMVTMYNLAIDGKVTVKATNGFPSLVINRDLYLKDDCKLTTEGLVQIGGSVLPTFITSPSAKWDHRGPLVVRPGGTISNSLNAKVTIEWRLDRQNITPVGRMIVAVPQVSYSEE